MEDNNPRFKQAKAGDYWTKYLELYPELHKVWISIPEPTNTYLRQQIDIFASKYPYDRIASLEAENARLKAGARMKWVKTLKKFPVRGMKVPIRFSNDGIVWEKEINDYFYLIKLSQKGFNTSNGSTNNQPTPCLHWSR